MLLISACNNKPEKSVEQLPEPKPVVATINYALIKSYPHDTNSFTEGFLFHEGKLYESTGATDNLPQTRSLFGIVDTSTGKINVKAELDRNKYFGEGISFLSGKVFQLTYQTKVGFIYDEKTFRKLGEFTIPSAEGWGMTNDGTNLIMSDGTNTLTYLDPNNLQVLKTVSVSENGYAKDYVNELEYINGFIYANIWMTNTIVKIDTTGVIVGKMDLTQLANDAKSISSGSSEMNGIAFDPASDKILVTGKMWPRIYEITFSH
jgi:glutamine cyclotransferase